MFHSQLSNLVCNSETKGLSKNWCHSVKNYQVLHIVLHSTSLCVNGPYTSRMSVQVLYCSCSVQKGLWITKSSVPVPKFLSHVNGAFLPHGRQASNMWWSECTPVWSGDLILWRYVLIKFSKNNYYCLCLFSILSVSYLLTITGLDNLTLMLLVANFPIQNDAKNWKMTETLAHGYSSEGTQREVSKQHQHDKA